MEKKLAFSGTRAELVTWLNAHGETSETGEQDFLETLFGPGASPDVVVQGHTEEGGPCTRVVDGETKYGVLTRRCWTNPGETEQCTGWRCVLVA